MLSIGKLGQGQADYYLDSVAAGIEDYYTGAGEAPGRWTGSATAEMEVSGRVEPDGLHAALEGKHPQGGSRLVSRSGGTRVPGFDLTFRAPKSVSVLFGLGEPRVSREVREAHEAAVEAAMAYMERHAAVARRGRGGAESVSGNGFVGAAFRHRSSRAGDPQLHTHVLVANMTRGPDGRWTALDARRIYAHAKTGGFLYQAQLRAELTRRLGVEWTRVHNGTAEIVGIPSPVLRAFSRRRVDIERVLAQRGERSAKAAQVAALDTRRAKDYRVTAETLSERWRDRAERLDFAREQINVLTASASGREPECPRTEQIADRLARPDGLTRARSTFTRRDVLQATCEQLPEGADLTSVERLADTFLEGDHAVVLARDVSALTHRDVIRRADGRVVAATAEQRRYSTPELLALENRAINTALSRQGERTAVAKMESIDQSIRRRPTLGPDQAEMVRCLTDDGAGVQVVTGKAGTGKTFALDAAREAWEADGHRVIGAAVARRAACELQDGAGIASTSLHALLQDLRAGERLDERTVVVVDEAGMAATRQLAELLDHAHVARAKVVLVGDDRQLPEIDAGGLFRALAVRTEAIELTENRRQVHRWEREALDDLREGRPEHAIAKYQSHGRVFLAEDAEQVRERLVRDWFGAIGRGHAVMVAARRDDVSDLNRRARQLMAASDQLGDEPLTIADRDFATGDHVVLLKNNHRLGITNGTRGILKTVDADAGELELQTTDGRSVRIPSSYLSTTTERGGPTIDHAYAITGHKAQGMTTTRAFVLGTDDLYREWGYVAMSRGREENRIYVVASRRRGREEYAPAELHPDPLNALTNALRHSQAQSAASDIASREGLREKTTEQLLHERSRLARELNALPPRARDRPTAPPSSRTSEADRLATAAAERVEELVNEIPRRRRARDPELAAARARLAHARERVDELTAREEQLHESPPRVAQPADSIGRHAAIGHELDRRLRHLAGTAAIERPAHLTAELGPYPDRPSHRRTWDRAAARIEMYREDFGIDNPNSALGPEPRELRQRSTWRAAQHDLRRAQTALDLRGERSRARARERGRGLL